MSVQITPKIKDRFDQIMTQRGLMPSTQEIYNIYFNKFQNGFLGGAGLVEEQDLLIFLSKGRGATNRYNDVGKAFAKLYAKSAGFPLDLERETGRARKLKKQDKQPMSDNDFDRLLSFVEAAGDFWLSLMLRLGRTTGMRRKEMLDMKWENIDHENLEINVIGKGNKVRKVFISEEISYELQGRQAKHKFPWPSTLCGYDSRVNDMLDSYLNKAGLKRPGVGLHTICRHSFATNLLNKDVKLEVIKELLGHSKIDTTLRYTHMNREKLRESWEKQ